MDFSEAELTSLINDISQRQTGAFISGFICSMFLTFCFMSGFIGFKALMHQDRQELVAPVVQPR